MDLQQEATRAEAGLRDDLRGGRAHEELHAQSGDERCKRRNATHATAARILAESAAFVDLADNKTGNQETLHAEDRAARFRTDVQ